MTPLVRGYLEYLTHERRLSSHTTGSYARDIAALTELAGAAPVENLQAHQVRRFVAQLHGRGLDGRTLARMLSAWRGFFAYLARDHGCTQNPVLGIRAPKSGKKLPQALSPDEAARLIEIGETNALAVRSSAR
jgi:integrase/recombinase XerC